MVNGTFTACAGGTSAGNATRLPPHVVESCGACDPSLNPSGAFTPVAVHVAAVQFENVTETSMSAPVVIGPVGKLCVTNTGAEPPPQLDGVTQPAPTQEVPAPQ
jgi:hypothetical protein